MRKAITVLLLVPSFIYAQNLDPIPRGINRFGLDVCEQFRAEPDYLFSPASISAALGMTYLGAKGVTKEQIKEVFYYPKDDEFMDGFAKFNTVFESTDSATEISMANKLWGDESRINLVPDFLEKNKTYFDSELKVLDFNKAEESRVIINDWIAANTNDKIKDLLEEGFISAQSVLVLTNALYFKSSWAKKFDPLLTYEGNFINDQNAPLKVDFMSAAGYYNTCEDEFVDMVELPYADGKFSFLVLLPKNSMKELQEQLYIENYERWSLLLNRREFEFLAVPKFKTSSKFKLEETLPSMGMPIPFSRGANFLGLGTSPLGNIFVDKAVHQTFLEFNEEGTEAAAATAVGMAARSMPPPPKRFIADRPFIYILRHIETNTILFMGKMSNPAYSEDN